MRFGRLAPIHDARTFKFARYRMASMPAAPDSCNLVTGIMERLGIVNPATIWPMDDNDTLGNCTIAGIAHAVTTYRGMLHEVRVPSAADVDALYFKLTGGPDSGLMELDVLNYWRQNTFADDQIMAFVAIDPKNHEHVKQAVAYFGGSYIGFQVQENACEDFTAGKTWDAGPLTQDGHAVYVVGYDANGVWVLTWGGIQKATWAWWDCCVACQNGEAWVILPPESQVAGFATGFDFETLKADLAALAKE